MKSYFGFITAVACVSLTTFAATPSSQANPAVAAPKVVRVLDHALDADLIAAVTKGDRTAARDLLARGADPNAKDPGFLKGTALTAASTYYAGNVEIVQALVEAGADLEGQNWDGETPLTIAVMGSHVELIQYLVKAGANLESNSFHALTPLMSAVLLPNSETVRLLIALGANVNARSDNNVTALFSACGANAGGDALEMVKMLVNAGADVGVKTTNGKRAADYADENKLRDIGDYLQTIEERDLALMNAAGEIFNKRSDATFNGWNAIKSSLDAGANPRYSNSQVQGKTTLILLSADTAHYDDATMRRIVAHSDLNAQNDDGQTALFYATDYNNASLVSLLLQAGADPNLADKKGRTPLDVAFIHNNKSLINTLVKVGARDNALWVDANGDTKLMLLMLEKPFNAARAEMLIKAGVDVDATTTKIDTALMFACDASSPKAVKFLLQNGANVNFIDADGETALMYAARHKTGTDALDIVQQLITAKVDVNAKDKQGNTALSLARANANLEVADALRKAGAKDDDWA